MESIGWLPFVVLIPRLLLVQSNLPETRNPSHTTDGDYLWEGDMRLSKFQVDLLYGDPFFSTRKAINVKAMRWPNGEIPYRFDLTVNRDRDKSLIREAMAVWMNRTCLKFTEVPGTFQEPHLIFTKKSGCWSDVGRKFWHNGQELSLGYGCENLGTILHELGHVIGFYHEHSRPDRDKYIKVIYKNIKSGKNENFKKQTNVNNHGVPYDYDSIMHYSINAFSENDQKTLVPVDPTKEFAIGQRDHLSFYDVKLANLMYSCGGECEANCLNGGYAHGSTCQCECPPEFTGETCENAIKTEKCGGYITSPTNVTSPNFPNFYPDDSQCIWWIKAPENKHVQITVHDFDLAPRGEDDQLCYWDSLEVRTEDKYKGNLYCGEELLHKTLTSKTEDLVLLFLKKRTIYRGFFISVNFV